MSGGEWQNVSCYDAAAKRDVNVAAVSIDPQTLEGLADAHLFADALNVANETGLSPRQLAEQNKELLAACKSVIPANMSLTNKNIPDDTVVPLETTMGALRKIAAVIAKATGVA